MYWFSSERGCFLPNAPAVSCLSGFRRSRIFITTIISLKSTFVRRFFAFLYASMHFDKISYPFRNLDYFWMTLFNLSMPQLNVECLVLDASSHLYSQFDCHRKRGYWSYRKISLNEILFKRVRILCFAQICHVVDEWNAILTTYRYSAPISPNSSFPASITFFFCLDIFFLYFFFFSLRLSLILPFLTFFFLLYLFSLSLFLFFLPGLLSFPPFWPSFAHIVSITPFHSSAFSTPGK